MSIVWPNDRSPRYCGGLEDSHIGRVDCVKHQANIPAPPAPSASSICFGFFVLSLSIHSPIVSYLLLLLAPTFPLQLIPRGVLHSEAPPNLLVENENRLIISPHSAEQEFRQGKQRGLISWSCSVASGFLTWHVSRLYLEVVNGEALYDSTGVMFSALCFLLAVLPVLLHVLSRPFLSK